MRRTLQLSVILLTLAVAGCASVPADSSAAFEAFLDEADAAQLEFQQGRPAQYIALWSHAPDVTLGGGFGGEFEKGWEGVRSRLQWAGSQFLNGQHDIHRIAYAASGNLGYLVQTEHLTFNTPGKAERLERDYRVTMLFRREEGKWRIIHRHADSQNEKAAPK